MRTDYELPKPWIQRIAKMVEFAMGGTQVTVRLKNGTEIRKVTISNCKWIIEAQGYDSWPFKMEEIEEIYQTDEDKKDRSRERKYF
ncbi:hypothetical protein IEN85_10165 [Pelagicoccus sp. NFK12]|uniref:Uncharacterized protein n=1 Tax=Pelagicoccus enzymogenes TaxID=2773457 RepID=A0A927FAF4_9BACT|nr:hypothetical protein [Pelagicoccus enzymogenes]MBD5779853.1 hypothetical protein [Pelagicoccus enzymogenes]